MLDILRQAGFEGCQGEEATVDLMNPAPLEAVAAIATNLGISARIVKAYEGTAEDFAAIATVVARDFRPYVVPGGVSVPAPPELIRSGQELALELVLALAASFRIVIAPSGNFLEDTP